jgi:hypothetical protein
MVGAAQCWPDLLDLRLGLGRRFAGQPRRFCAHRFIDDRHRAAQAWCAAVRCHDAAPRLAALPARTLAARRWRSCACARQFRDALSRWPAVGHHLGLCALRLENSDGPRRRRGVLGLLAAAGAYFSGIASATVHGWLWLVAAFVGSVLGTYLRPWFGLSVEGNLAGAQAGPTARD